MIDTDKYEELLAEVKRLREVIDKEHPTFDWASRQTIANLDAEVKRLREWKKLVSDIVQQQDGSHLREMLKELIE